MKTCMVILNPSSGKEQALNYEKLIVEQLQQYKTDVRYTEGAGDATKFAREACDKRYDVVVLVGGDGTLNEGVNGIAEQPYRPTIGIIPLGTVNDFARALDIPLEPEEAIKLLGGTTRQADIGKANATYFTNIVAIGELAHAVGDVSVEQKSKLGSLAYLVEGVKAAVQNDSYALQVTANGKTFEQETMLFLCALTNSVGSFGKINEQADAADGLLHVFIIKSGSVLDVVSTAKDLLTGKAEQSDNIIAFDTAEVQLQSETPMSLNVDGDNIGFLPATIAILPSHITVFSPTNTI